MPNTAINSTAVPNIRLFVRCTQIELPEEVIPEPQPEVLPEDEQIQPAVPKPRKRSEEPVQREIPDKVSEKNAPSGIWTEERNLFPEPDADELEMLKEKKRSRSNKTQRLFDAIMKEPEDNPNVTVRKKKGGGSSFTV